MDAWQARHLPSGVTCRGEAWPHLLSHVPFATAQIIFLGLDRLQFHPIALQTLSSAFVEFRAQAPINALSKNIWLSSPIIVDLVITQ